MKRNISTDRGSALAELPFFIAGVALIMWLIAKFAFIGMHEAQKIVNADAAVKKEWVK